MFHFLRKLIRPHQARSVAKQPSPFRPTLEALEGRWAPAVLTVNSLADNTTADKTLTLREAINVVDGTLGRALSTAEKAQVTGTLGSNDTIQFQLSAGPQTITLTGGALSITKAVAITGPGAGLLKLNGNNAGRVLLVGHDYSQNLSLNVSLSGLTISGGTANYGGGLLNFGTLTVSNCTFTSNAAGSSGGGGIYNDGAMTVASSTFSGNSVSNGGQGAGILVTSSATLNVTGSTFTGNTAPNGGEGGGIANSGTLNVAGCTFSNNTVGSNGGGIHNSSTGKLTVTTSTFTNGVCTSDGGGFDSDGSATVTYCTFANNTVGSEGGAIDSHGTLTLSNSTFVGNTSVSRGGALNISGSSQITNCTITGNRVSSSSGSGGGIYDSTAAKIYNDIVTGNFRGPTPGTTANDIVGNVISTSSFNLIGTGGAGGLVNGANGNQVGVTNPGLGALANNAGPTQTMALLPGSPAIDRGGNASVANGVTDQRGLTRIVNGTVDIGAFEVQAPSGTTASAFTVAGFPTSIQAGVVGTITVTAKDSSGTTVAGYTGTVHFTSSDLQGSLPGDYTYITADHGVHTFNVTLKTTGTQSITAQDTVTGSITGIQSGVIVTPAPASTLSVAGFPNPTVAGTAGTFSVTALDAFGNRASGYRGTIHITTTDTQGTLPADYTFVTADNGVHSFNATFKTAGSQSLTATDNSTGVTGVHAAILVNPASASVLSVAGFPSPAPAGVADTFTVTARDSFGNTTGYLGTIQFTSSDSQAVLPANYTFVTADNGVHSFSATFQTAGTQTITATDMTTATITGTQAAITVNPAPTGPVLLVNSTADNTTADNVLTLREAIAVVNGTLGRTLTTAEQAQITGTLGPDDAIQFSLPAGPQTITLTGGALDITQPVALIGTGAINLTIDGNHADRVFIVGHDYSQDLSLNVSLSGLTISGGTANYGGGLLNFGTLTLSDDTFAGNSAGSSGGGAIYNDGALNVTNSTFSANSASNGGPGGAIQNASPATLTIANCTFSSNTATGGASGAAIANSGQLTVAGTSITGNSADSNAGGIYNSSEGTLNVSTTTVANNTSGSDGGGIDNDGTATVASSTLANNSAASEGGGLGNKGALTLTNCTLYGNTAVSDGGGLQTSGPSVTVTNCTITANRVTAGPGGGIYAATPAQLFNTIVAGNFHGPAPSTTADDIAGTVDSSSAFNLIGVGGAGGLTNGVNNNQVGVSNLGLGTLANNGGPTMTVVLLAGSPAIDHGGNTFVVAGETDQRGLARIVNGVVDIGAFESQ